MKSRHVLKLKTKEKGLCPLYVYLKRLKVNDICVIKPNPKENKHLPHRRFFGKVGKVIKVHYRNYEVKIDRKIINTTAAHLKILNE